MSVLSVLGLIFITLKLLGVIDWNWFLVLMPFIVHALIFLLVLVGVALHRWSMTPAERALRDMAKAIERNRRS